MAKVTCNVTGVGWVRVTGIVTGDASLMAGQIVRRVQRDFHRPTHKIVPATGRQSGALATPSERPILAPFERCRRVSGWLEPADELG